MGQCVGVCWGGGGHVLSGARGHFIPGCVVIRVLYEVTLQDGCRQTWLSSRPSKGKLVMLTP